MCLTLENYIKVNINPCGKWIKLPGGKPSAFTHVETYALNILLSVGYRLPETLPRTHVSERCVHNVQYPVLSGTTLKSKPCRVPSWISGLRYMLPPLKDLPLTTYLLHDSHSLFSTLLYVNFSLPCLSICYLTYLSKTLTSTICYLMGQLLIWLFQVQPP